MRRYHATVQTASCTMGSDLALANLVSITHAMGFARKGPYRLWLTLPMLRAREMAELSWGGGRHQNQRKIDFLRAVLAMSLFGRCPFPGGRTAEAGRLDADGTSKHRASVVGSESG